MPQAYRYKDECLEPLANGALYILQGGAAPRFSLDSCLLAGFCRLRPGDRAADFCSGTGIIPLLLYLRQSAISVEALELMPEAADMASRSFALNGLGSLHMHRGDVKEAARLLEGGFDLITCNPPYFPLSACRVSADRLRAAAKCELYCTLADCVASAAALLKQGGRLALSIRYERRLEARELLEAYGLRLNRELDIRDNESAPCWLALLEAEKAGEPLPAPVTDILRVFDEKRLYTSAMRELCRAWL